MLSGFETDLGSFTIKKRIPTFWEMTLGGSIVCIPIFQNDIMYFGACDGYIYAVDILKRKEIWRFRTGGWIWWQPVAWKDRIYFTSWDCHLHCVDLQGKEVWRFATSTLTQTKLPPPFEAWQTEIKIKEED